MISLRSISHILYTSLLLSQKQEIPDPDAEKPEDWDDEDDGEWEAPMLPNPDYKGEWKPKKIDNPDYKGKWVHPMIDNPDFKDDDTIYQVCKKDNPCTHVGFELWQVTSGTLFDDIIVTDDEEEAKAYAQETYFKKKDPENDMFAEVQKKKAEEEAADMDDMDMDMDMDDMDMDDMDGMFDEF